jgi:DNA polymerase-1
MERTGITVNRTFSSDNRELGVTAAELATRAYAEIGGREINLGSPKQLQPVLFEDLQMPKTRSNKTGYSTDAASLAVTAGQVHTPSSICCFRDATKLRQIVDTLERRSPTTTGCRTRYDQTGTSTVASRRQTDLQNIPVRTSVGLRSHRRSRAGGPNPVDRGTTPESKCGSRTFGRPRLIEPSTQEDLHQFVGSWIFGVDPADVSSIILTKVKAMSYGASLNRRWSKQLHREF